LEQLRGEKQFFDVGHRIPTRAREALQRLRALDGDDRIRIDFGEKTQDGTMRIYVRSVSETASVVSVEGNGRIMLMTYFHQEPRVVGALKDLERKLGKPPKQKPTYSVGEWEWQADAVVKLIEDLAGPSATSAKAAGAPAERINDAVSNDHVDISPTSVEASASAAVVPGPDLDPHSDASLSALVEEIEPDPDMTDPAVRQQFTRWVRARQSQFRTRLLNAYGRTCCITGWGPDEVLEAAHIDGHAESRDNRVQNGLLLRADLHGLFDEGLLRINPDTLEVVIDPRLEPWYRALGGQKIRLPTDPRLHPDPEKLRARWLKPF
jgi:hypothetical protein